MQNFLSPSNPLYVEYQKILIQLIRLVPHNQFLEEYIVSNFFPWKEQYFNPVLDVCNELLVHSKEQNMFSSKIFTSNDYSDKINKTREILEDIPPKTIKISVAEKNIVLIHPFSPLEANYDKEKNTLSLSSEEENLLNNGHFKKEVSKRFDTIKNKIETFYQDNKSKHKTTLKECFTQLSNFVIDNEHLKLAYKDEPELVHENLDLLGFKDFNETCWQDLKTFIEEKKIIVDKLVDSNDISKEEEEQQLLLANNLKKLTNNQTVLLLQEIGFFSHPKIEEASKVKQAALIRQLTGYDAKNIKTKIELLGNNPKENGAQYAKDQTKIENILNDLI